MLLSWRLLFLAVLSHGVLPALAQTTSIAAPRINGAMVFGVRPGRPFLYTIAVSGDRPMQFSATDLPRGLFLDPISGHITGAIHHRGTYVVRLSARNAAGRAQRELRVVVGDKIALTPPMGWNSWYVWSEAVSAEKIRSAARAMVDKHLVDHGWTFVNIDDCWQGPRRGKHKALQGNERFPDMKGLADYVHSLGLKVGLYSTPWMSSYAGFAGGSAPSSDGDYSSVALPLEQRLQPFQLFGRWPMARSLGVQKIGAAWFVDNDIKQWADWGIDYVKFDWKPNDVPTTRRIAKALAASKRDIVFSLSNEAPFSDAKEWAKYTNLWRTTADIRDDWDVVSGIGFSQDRWVPYIGPGHWADPDMLQVGQVGVPNTLNRELKSTRLSEDEQYTQFTLWSLLSAPLLLSCDIESMDEFTLKLLTNDEVIDVDQDPLGKAAVPVSRTKDSEVWAKSLEGGLLTVGLFNRTEQESRIVVQWSDLGIKGERLVRDLWRHEDIGSYREQVAVLVRPHGVVLLKIGHSKTAAN